LHEVKRGNHPPVSLRPKRPTRLEFRFVHKEEHTLVHHSGAHEEGQSEGEDERGDQGKSHGDGEDEQVVGVDSSREE